MDDIFHSRFTAFVLLGSFVVAVNLLTGAVMRPWSYGYVNDKGVRGSIARGYLVSNG